MILQKTILFLFLILFAFIVIDYCCMNDKVSYADYHSLNFCHYICSNLVMKKIFLILVELSLSFILINHLLYKNPCIVPLEYPPEKS